MKLKRTHLLTLGGTALCLLALAGAYALTRPALPAVNTGTPGGAMVVNPMQPSDADGLAQQGYSIPLPAGAEDPAYFLFRLPEQPPMAQVTFRLDGAAYTCRAQKANAPCDISGLYADWSAPSCWQADGLELQLEQTADGTARVSWYQAHPGTQWSLTGGTDAPALLAAAHAMVTALGYSIDLSSGAN